MNISFEDFEDRKEGPTDNAESETSSAQGSDEADPGARLQTEVFEVPEFLYKYSSTFFKKSSLQEKRIHKIFGKMNEKEKVKIQTDRPIQELPEEESSPEKKSERYTASTLNRNFRKKDTSTSDIRLRQDREDPEGSSKRRKKHLRYFAL